MQLTASNTAVNVLSAEQDTSTRLTQLYDLKRVTLVDVNPKHRYVRGWAVSERELAASGYGRDVGAPWQYHRWKRNEHCYNLLHYGWWSKNLKKLTKDHFHWAVNLLHYGWWSKVLKKNWARTIFTELLICYVTTWWSKVWKIYEKPFFQSF